jgi:hypothetical protein
MNIVSLAGEKEFMLLRERQLMVGRPKIVTGKPRSDTGTKRKTYNLKKETRGKVGKENNLARAFWGANSMDQMMQLSGQELEDHLEAWFQEFQARAIKRDPSWWYPSLPTKTINEIRNKRMKGVDKNIRIV